MPNHEREVATSINRSWPVLEQYFSTPAWRSSGTDPAAIMRGMPWADWTEQAGRVVAPLAAATAAAFGEEARAIGTIRGKLGFNVVDDVSIKYAQTQGSKLIAAITEAQRETVRTMVGDSLKGNWTVDELGARLRRTVGLHPAWAQAVNRFEERQKATLLREGKTEEHATTLAARRAEKKRAHLLKVRGENIARTEIQTASNLGKYATWDSAIGKGFASKNSLKEFSPGPGACDICAPISGEVVAWDAPFSNGKMMPPFHPGCRCTANILPPDYNDAELDPNAFDWLDDTNATTRPDFIPDLQNRIGSLTNRPAPFVAPPKVLTGEQAAEHLNENAVPGNDDERQAAGLYLGGASYNGALRSGNAINEYTQERIDQLTSLINKQPTFGTPTKLYRGTFLPEGTTVGTTFTEPAFMSTSLKRSEAQIFAGSTGDKGGTLVEITARGKDRALSINSARMPDQIGIPLEYQQKLNVLDHEAEMLLPHGTSLHVTSIEQRTIDGVTYKYVKADVVGTPAQAPLVTQHIERAPLTNPPIKNAKPLPPATIADDITLQSTAHMSDDQLVEMLTAKGDDPEAIDKILDVMDQREATAHDWTKWKAADNAAADAFDEEAHRASFGGVDDLFFTDTSSRTNPAKKATRGLTKDQEVEEQYYAYNLSQRAKALEDTNGNFFNAAGRKAFRDGKITEELLFEGQVARAKKYASEEMIQWWEENGRQSKGSFRYNALQRPSDRWYRDVVHSNGFQGRMGAARDRSTF